MLGLMFLRVVRVNSMSHVSRNQETISNDSVVVLLRQIWVQVPGNAFGGLDNHVAVCSLGRLRTNFFVIEEHDHADLRIILVASIMILYNRIK